MARFIQISEALLLSSSSVPFVEIVMILLHSFLGRIARHYFTRIGALFLSHPAALKVKHQQARQEKALFFCLVILSHFPSSPAFTRDGNVVRTFLAAGRTQLPSQTPKGFLLPFFVFCFPFEAAVACIWNVIVRKQAAGGQQPFRTRRPQPPSGVLPHAEPSVLPAPCPSCSPPETTSGATAKQAEGEGGGFSFNRAGHTTIII